MEDCVARNGRMPLIYRQGLITSVRFAVPDSGPIGGAPRKDAIALCSVAATAGFRQAPVGPGLPVPITGVAVDAALLGSGVAYAFPVTAVERRLLLGAAAQNGTGERQECPTSRHLG